MSADGSPAAGSPPTPAATSSAPPSPKTIVVASCTANQLSASIGRHGSAAGTENILIVLTNTSDHACTLGGKVELAAVRSDGTVGNPGFVSYTDPAYAPPSPVTGPGVVAPGASGGFVIGEGLNCPPIKGTYTALRIKIANGPTVEMPWSALFAGCSPSVGPAGPIAASAAR